MSCDHYRDTGKPFDFRFPCAWPRCPSGVWGYELIVPIESYPKTRFAVVDGIWQERFEPLQTKRYVRIVYGKGAKKTYGWTEERPNGK